MVQNGPAILLSELLEGPQAGYLPLGLHGHKFLSVALRERQALCEVRRPASALEGKGIGAQGR